MEKFNTRYDHKKDIPDNLYDKYVFILQGKKLDAGVSLTSQEFVAESDINNIIDKYNKTGIMDNSRASEEYYQDVSEYPSYQDALQTTINAKTSFDGLDPHLRNRFGNNPQALLSFLQDKENKKEAQKLGLLKPDKPIPPKPDPTEVIITEKQIKSAKEPKK